jgi:hypothetical protein
MRTLLFTVFLATSFCAPSSAQELSPADQSAADAAIRVIRPEAIAAHMRFLSDSMLEGRAPDSPGYQIAARYVATELEGMGLRPGGLNGTWFQPVPLRKAVLVQDKSSLTLVENGKSQTLAGGKDYVFNSDILRTESSVEAPLVFVGFGVTAPEENYDDYAGVDVHGKIVVMIYGGPSRFSSTVRAYYSDGAVKRRIAVAHGAVGRFQVALPEVWKQYHWDWIAPQEQAGSMEWLDKDGKPHDTSPEWKVRALLNEKVGASLFEGAPKTADEAYAAARAGQPQAFALAWTAKAHTESTHTDIESPNIVGKLEGSDPSLRDQYVVYTAHVDHLGICPPIDGDNVCHGTVDNASGVSTLLEIARAYASLPRPPRRSVLFVFVTGEEMGLLGSDYFAHAPIVPLSKIVANVNIDGAPGMLFSMKDAVAMGAEHSSINNVAESAARELGYALIPDPMPEENDFIRSDQYSFVLQGVPAVVMSDGITSTDPKINGLAIEKKWLSTRYHTPLDNMDQPLDYESGAKAAGLNFLVGYELAQRDQPPEWNKGDFFGTKFAQKR